MFLCVCSPLSLPGRSLTSILSAISFPLLKSLFFFYLSRPRSCTHCFPLPLFLHLRSLTSVVVVVVAAAERERERRRLLKLLKFAEDAAPSPRERERKVGQKAEKRRDYLSFPPTGFLPDPRTAYTREREDHIQAGRDGRGQRKERERATLHS